MNNQLPCQSTKMRCTALAEPGRTLCAVHIRDSGFKNTQKSDYFAEHAKKERYADHLVERDATH